MEEVGQEGNRDPEFIRKLVGGTAAFEMLKEMWTLGKIIVPEQEDAWRVISHLAERRQSAPANPEAARKLLAQHAMQESDAIVYKDPTGELEVDLSVDGDVFNPQLTKASGLLLTIIRMAELKDKRFLDAFAGTGLMGIYAAWAGAEVVAYDTAEAAVRCAEKNAFDNELADHIAVRHGDYTVLQVGERFDVITANPPLLSVMPSQDRPLESAVFDAEQHATVDFIGALPDHLTPDGRCYLLSSSTFDQAGRDIYTVSKQNRLAARLVVAMPREYEWYRVHEIRLASDVGD